ncbi:MAG: sulfatase-like hydrolase/transferase [Lentimonas sp.]
MMNTSAKNIIVIKTDQQRADTIAALGNPHMITPHMDRLVREGVSFSQAYCPAATCVASRAAFYTGMYAHNTGCYAFDEWAHNRSWVENIKDAGYRTAAIGKVHHVPHTAMMGYQERVMVENFPDMSNPHDDYANYLKSKEQESPCKLLTQDGKWLEKCTSDVFPLDEAHHVDQYVGRMAKRWIDDYDGKDPFYLHIGFQGPHDPFDPPQRFLDMYADRDVPLPHFDTNGLSVRPPQYERFMEATRNPHKFHIAPPYGAWASDFTGKSDEDFKRMRRHYYACITQIDEQIGLLMDSLEAKGLLDNTLILFTSDHGDNLGDHEMIYKWLMTDQVVNVPMIARLPGGDRGGALDNDLFSQIDIGPTCLTALGLDVPQRLDGSSNWKRMTEGDSSEAPDRVYAEDNYLTMIRTKTRKLIHYAGQKTTEYFNLEQDPWEEHNLADNPDYSQEILVLKAETMDWMTESRYLGSVAQINQDSEPRGVWPQNHPHDPYALNVGSIKPKP